MSAKVSAHWRDTELGDVITLQRGFDLPADERKPGSVPIVSSSGIFGTHSEARVKAPGVVTGRYGTIGQVFFVGKDFWPLNTTLFVKDFKGNDPLFVSYPPCHLLGEVSKMRRHALIRHRKNAPQESADYAFCPPLGVCSHNRVEAVE